MVLFLYLYLIYNIAIAQDCFNDWQENNACQKSTDLLCGGCYIQPVYPLSTTKNYPFNTVIIKADQTKLINKGLSNFNGNVLIAKNNQQLTADQAKVQQNAKGEIESFTAIGNVNLIEPNMRIIGTKAEVLQKNNYKIIYQANYRLYNRHARGTSDQIEIFDDNTLHLPNASYTTCKPHSNTWCLKAKKLIINKTIGRGEAWDTKMYLKDVPIFYLPYINFPIDDRRQSGFLLPSFGINSKNGTTISTPFYVNLAENYDYTLSPIYMSHRGIKFDNKFRYLTQKSSGNWQFNFLSTNKFRYATWITNNINITNNWNLFIKYNKVSDNNYLYDFGQDLGQINQKIVNNIAETSLEETMQNSSLHLEQSVKLENFNKYGLFKVRLLQYQTLYPTNGPIAQEQYKKMPEILWNSNYIYLPNNYRTKYSISYIDFKLRSFDHTAQKPTGKRIHLLPSLEHNFYTSYGSLKPRIQLDTLSYHDLNLANNNSRITPIFDVNSGLTFSKTLTNNLQQTLEPKIYYLYVPKIKQHHYPIFDTSVTEFSYDQLFRSNRYNGPDRLAEANQITFGLKSNFYQQSTGEEQASIGIARAIYLRGLTAYLGENLDFGKWSPIGIVLNYRINPKLSLEANIVRQKLNQTRTSNFSGQYRFSEQQIINLGYQYSKFTSTPQHQGQTSITWAITNNLNFLGKLDYDLNQKRSIYNLAGVEIHGCCLILRLAYSRSLLPTDNLLKKQYNNKILAQIIFKGLNNGEVGNLSSNEIFNKIPGYMPKTGF